MVFSLAKLPLDIGLFILVFHIAQKLIYNVFAISGNLNHRRIDLFKLFSYLPGSHVIWEELGLGVRVGDFPSAHMIT